MKPVKGGQGTVWAVAPLIINTGLIQRDSSFRTMLKELAGEIIWNSKCK
jgi:hypothetical protein